jgi:hypothetical protein
MPTPKIEIARELANQTWEVLQSSEIPEPKQEIAFGAIFAFLAQGGTVSGPATPEADQPGPAAADERATGLAGIAKALNVDEETVSHMYDIDGRDLDLTISRDDLSSDRATAMREVALLVVAGRQAAGIDKDRTDSNQVRSQGVHLGVMAKNTFRQEMGALNPQVTSKPLGRSGRALKITRIGYDAAGRIAQRIAAKAEE